MPDSYHSAVKEIATKDKISINQFVVSAVAEKIASFETAQYLEKRAAFASKEKFMSVLAKVPSAEIPEIDR